MIAKPIRRAHQLVTDPVLRRWLARRLIGANPPPAFVPHRPPYLPDLAPPDGADPSPPKPFRRLAADAPARPIELPLPGLSVRLEPAEAPGVFDRAFDDIETKLALHRFAWLPLVPAEDVKPWAQALWDAWRRDFGECRDGWAWHPYTAAERAVNLLDFADAAGLPEPADDTAAVLARHADVIHRRLEYFGEHDTSNHLSNNGRGLYRLGLALGIGWAAERGAKILLEEAKRIFLPSGILREGSSHYHLLIARNYADAWLNARAFGRAEEPALRAIATRALAVAPRLMLPGGLPLVGDVSPDCPPEYLACLTGGGGGWAAGLKAEARAALVDLLADATRAGTVDGEALRRDGWFRFTRGPWSCLWHWAPAGWPPMPGHAHQDLGSFEAHLDDLPVFVDPGRGRYGETGEAALYRSGRVHNTLLVDGRDPYPPNKPYYDDDFRAGVIPAPPSLRADGDEVTLVHHGFRRLRGVGALARRWRFGTRVLTVEDRLDGHGRRPLVRRFVTPLAVEALPGGVLLTGGGRTFWLSADGEAAMTIRPVTIWHAYGVGRPGHLIEFADKATLPWSGRVTLEVS